MALWGRMADNRSMDSSVRLIDRHRLLWLLGILLSIGFFATTLFGYFVSKEAIRSAIIGQDLPLTSSNIYSEIQKDLVRPVLIAENMAHDTFVRDWIMRGENQVDELSRYLAEIKQRHGAFSSFLVSEKSRNYYTGTGILKQISPNEPRDVWYFRIRDLKENYEINVDPDLANRDMLTIFINYRVFDFAGNYIGTTGIGLTVDAVRHLVSSYQQRFQRTIYFVDTRGHVVDFGKHTGLSGDLRTRPGLGPMVERILQERTGSYQFEEAGDNHILNVNYLPELKWYLFVEQNEEMALAEIRQTLYINLAISLLVTLIVTALAYLALGRYQSRIEEMASTDKLTGLLNRHAYSILIDNLMAGFRRKQQSITFLLADVDHFKAINDRYGHRIGDEALVGVAHILKASLREMDFAVRWGGEEFLIVLRDCPKEEGEQVADKLRRAVEEATPCPSDARIKLTISIGISQYDGIEDIDQTVNRADTALYSAKNAGRNLVCMAAEEIRSPD